MLRHVSNLNPDHDLEFTSVSTKDAPEKKPYPSMPALPATSAIISHADLSGTSARAAASTGTGALSALLNRIKEAIQSSSAVNQNFNAVEADPSAVSTLEVASEPDQQGSDAIRAASGASASTSGSSSETAPYLSPRKRRDTPTGFTSTKQIWEAAWQGLEPPEVASQQAAQRLREQRKPNAPQAQRGSAAHTEEASVQVVGKPSLALQGLKPAARAQLLAVSMLALEMQLEPLPADFLRDGTEEEWALLLPAILSSCSVTAARGWLNYVPPELHSKAAVLVRRLNEGCGKYSVSLSLPFQPSIPTLTPVTAPYPSVVTSHAPEAGMSGPQGADAGVASSDSESPGSLWESAAERRTLHAICIRGLCSLKLACEGNLDEVAECSSSASTQDLGFRESRNPNAAPGPSIPASSSQAFAVGSSDDSAKAEAKALEGARRNSGGRGMGTADAQEEALGQDGGDHSQTGRMHGVQRVARRSAAGRASGDSSRDSAGVASGRVAQPFGWILGGRREQRPQDTALAAGGMKEEKVRSALRTKEAARQLLESETGGIRGWGVPSGPRRHVTSMAPSILQDMAVVIAEAVAVCYLAEAGLGIDGGPSAASSTTLQHSAWPTFLHPSLANTRALERFRNQIAFQQFLGQNWGAVLAMYEDKHSLWGVGPGARIIKRTVPARRAKDLQKLTGWRYMISLVLEALDFLTPLVRQLGQKGGDALSWLLVTLIGRSLGLVFRGVRQSLRPQRKPAEPQQQSHLCTC